VLRNWAFLHPEIPWQVRLHDYFACQECGATAIWDDPVIRCMRETCRQVLVRSEPGSCPICGDPECVRRVDQRVAEWARRTGVQPEE
jgi:hypothetical protein